MDDVIEQVRRCNERLISKWQKRLDAELAKEKPDPNVVQLLGEDIERLEIEIERLS